MLLEVALAAKASHLITGDEDLLMLDPWRGIRILTPADFEAVMEGASQRPS